MADKGTIETKLKLTGEDDYQKALKAAYGQLRVLNSELKASTSALGNNATAEQKNAVKADVLKRKIAEQKKIVEQLKAALNQAKTEYAGNAEVIQKWQVKLNNAQNALNNMTNDLDRATNGVEKMGNAMERGASNGAQAVVNLGDVINSVKGLCESLGSVITDTFRTITNNIKTAVDTGWQLITGAMADAHNWTGVKQVYGGNTADIERMFRTAEYAGYDGTKVTSLMNKLVSRTHSGTKDTVDALAKLGITQGKYNNHFDFYQAVWDALQEKQAKGEDITALTQQIFGKGSWEDAAGMIVNWSEAQKRYANNIEQTGLGLSDEQIKAMDDAWHKINELRTTWAALRTSLGTKIWIKLGLTHVADGVITLLQDVAKLFNNPNDHQLILKVTTDLSEIITSVLNSLSILGTDLTTIGQGLIDNSDGNDTVKSIGQLLVSVGKFCDWVVENSSKIIDALTKYIDFQIAKLTFQIEYPALYTLLQNLPGFIEQALTIFALMKTWKIATTGANTAETILYGSWISRIVGGVSSAASSFMNSGAGPMALSLWLSQVVPNISPEVHDFLYNDPFNPDGTKQGQFTKMQQDEKTAIQAFSRFIGKDVDISAWAWGYASDLIPEWYTSPYGYQLYKQSDAVPYGPSVQKDGSVIYLDNNKTKAYGLSLLTSGLASEYFIQWMSDQTDTTGNKYNNQHYTGMLGSAYKKYLEYLEQQEVDAITAGSNPGSDMNMWGSTPQSKWDMLTTLMQLQFGHTDSEQYGNYHMMLQATWPDMLQQWEKFVGYQQAWGDGTLDYETAYQEFLHTWIPKYYGFDGSYYEPGGGFYTQPVTTQTYGDVEGDYEPWTPPWANDGKVTLTQESANILAGALVGMAVQMDGQKVGWLAGPGVSQYLAANA